MAQRKDTTNLAGMLLSSRIVEIMNGSSDPYLPKNKYLLAPCYHLGDLYVKDTAFLRNFIYVIGASIEHARILHAYKQ